MHPKYFPLGIAKGRAFCNRVIERKRLKDNIRASRHSLVISPRRYGKSSLVLYVMNELKILGTRVDLFVTTDERKIEQEIIAGVKNIISQVVPKHEQVLQTIKDYIKKLELKLIVGSDGVNLELIPTGETDPARSIKSTLLLLEHILVTKRKKAVFFIDECQEIGIVASNKGIEGAIRHVAQEVQQLTFIFSGSNRYMLGQMFNDRSRPLYKLCDRVTLNRIHKQDYELFIQKISIEQWGDKLPINVISKVFTATELHPYYINVLCGRIWDIFTEKSPTRNTQIEKIWTDYTEEQKSEIAKELSLLSELQKKLIISIALGNNRNLTGKKVLQRLNTTSAAVVKALNVLEDRDYIYASANGGYNVLDPLIKMSIKLSYGETIFEQNV